MTRLADRVPVEPLASERVQRVEDRVATAFARARTETPIAPRRRAWLWAPVAAFAAAAIAFVALRVSVDPAPAAEPTRIATPAGDGTTVSIGDATIAIAGRSAVEILRDPGGGIEIQLHRGQVDCEVAPRPNRPAFAVLAGEVAVHVVGTRFSVARDDEVRVGVTRGEVRITVAGEHVAVAAGERWSRAVASSAPLPRWAVAAADAPRLATAEVERGSAAAPAPAPAAPLEVVDEPAPPTSSAPVASRRDDRAARRQPEARRAPELAPEAAAERDPNPGDVLPPPFGGAPPNARFEALLELEQTDLDGAIAAYQKSLRGDEGEYALYRLAYVEYSKRRRTRSALRFAEAVEKRFPKGTYAPHAHWLRIHALHGAGDKSACRAAAQSYLRRYAAGDHREHARRLMDWY